MKKILLFASALAGLFLAGSCQRENLEPMESANTVTYTVQLPGALSTKTIGEKDADVAAVTELVYEVYRTEATSADDFTKAEARLFQKRAPITNGTATVEFELVNDQNFRVLFWAQVPGNGVYTFTNLKNVTIAQALNANAENYAAFAGADYIKAGESIVGRTLPLVRPIAQLNIGTDDASLDIEGHQTDVVISTTAVTVNGLSTTFNVAENKAGDISDADYVYKAMPVARTAEYPGLSESTFAVNGINYNYVAMNYVGFAPQMGTNVKVTYTINTENVGTITNTIDNVPVKANHRTNIVGNLITSMSDYTITLNKDWADEELAPEAIYLAATLGGEFTLDEDLVLEAPVVVPANTNFVLNLNGKSIKNTTQSEVFGKGEGIIAYGNLTINGEGTVEGSTMAVWARGNDGAKVTINGGTYKGCAEGFAKGGRSVIYASSGNVIDINGGTFESLSADKTSYANKTEGVYAALNVADNNGMINVYGGTFVGQNPAAPGTEPSAWNATHPNGFVAEGYIVVKEDGFYRVLSGVTIESKDAFETALSNPSVDAINLSTALEYNNTECVIVQKDVTIYADGKTITAGGADDLTPSIAAIGDYDVVIDNANIVGGFVCAQYGADVVVDGGSLKFTDGKSGRNCFYAASNNELTTITIKDVDVNMANASGNTYLCAHGNAIIYVEGGNFYGKPVGSSHPYIKEAELGSYTGKVIITGGTFNFDPSEWVADNYIAIKNADATYTVVSAIKEMEDGAVLDLNGVEFPGTIVAKGNLTIMGDTKVKTLKATNGGTITIEDGKTLTLNNFSFGATANPQALYEIKGGTVTANYGFFQHGIYTLRSNFETGYMYYSFGSDITVYGTFHSMGKGDGLDYVRGKLTIANGGKSIHDKSLWVGQPASWGAMEASLTIENGGYVQANTLSVYEGSSLTYFNDADLKYNTVSGEDYITKK